MSSTIELGMPPVGGSVLLADPRGYCAGVDRAVITVEKALDLYGAPVYVRKQIVHNKHVVNNLSERGAIFVEELDEVPEGATVVFSAHGVSPMVHAEAAERSLKTIDATCPLVTKVHHEARRFATEGYRILLIGHEGHEEVEGTAGEAPEHITLVQTPDDVDDLEFPEGTRLSWLSQTTLSVDETMETVRRLREKFPQLEDPPSDDICYATQNRQVAVKEIAKNADLVIVVGSANSSNSVRLVEVALEAGAKASYRIDDISEIDEALARRRRARRRHVRRVGAGRPGAGGAGLPRRARPPGRPGRTHGRREPDLRAAARAPPRHEGRRPSLTVSAEIWIELHAPQSPTWCSDDPNLGSSVRVGLTTRAVPPPRRFGSATAVSLPWRPTSIVAAAPISAAEVNWSPDGVST